MRNNAGIFETRKSLSMKENGMGNEKKELAVKPSSIKDWLSSEPIVNGIVQALPDKSIGEQFMRILITQFVKNPKLPLCRRDTVLSCVVQCAQYGLFPDGRHAHLIPYGDVCQVIFDYKGLIALAKRAGAGTVFAQVVFKDDVFMHKIVDGRHTFLHEPNYSAPRKEPILFCSVYRGPGDSAELDVEVMTLEEVQVIQKRSKAGTAGPWVTDFNEMGKKTVIRRHSKRWDIAPELAAAFNDDDDKSDPLAKAKPVAEARFVDEEPPVEAAAVAVEPVVDVEVEKRDRVDEMNVTRVGPLPHTSNPLRTGRKPHENPLNELEALCQEAEVSDALFNAWAEAKGYWVDGQISIKRIRELVADWAEVLKDIRKFQEVAG
jgi:recombination protein RecT